MNAFNFEGGKIEEIFEPIKNEEIKNKKVELWQKEKKEKKFEIPHSLKGYFNKNEDGTIDIKTENGILERVSKDILPEDLKQEEQGELFMTFTNHSEISKKVLNELLKGNQDE
ncbi:MAG: hypothetical protein U9O55_01735 [Patescibacteria group bacterium]|nr:hypothetical protein [Patescibacteria group bacterium]